MHVRSFLMLCSFNIYQYVCGVDNAHILHEHKELTLSAIQTKCYNLKPLVRFSFIS